MRPSQIFAHWEQIRDDLLEAIDKFENSELEFRAFEGGFSAAKIMLHIADAEDGWLRTQVTRELDQWPDHYTLANYPTKEAIRAVLGEVHDRTCAYLESLEAEDLSRSVETTWGGSLPLGWIIWHIVEHEIHHRGELSLMLGMLGREGIDV